MVRSRSLTVAGSPTMCTKTGIFIFRASFQNNNNHNSNNENSRTGIAALPRRRGGGKARHPAPPPLPPAGLFPNKPLSPPPRPPQDHILLYHSLSVFLAPSPHSCPAARLRTAHGAGSIATAPAPPAPARPARRRGASGVSAAPQPSAALWRVYKPELRSPWSSVGFWQRAR